MCHSHIRASLQTQEGMCLPAKPPMTLPSIMVRTFLTLGLTISVFLVTCPSAMMTTYKEGRTLCAGTMLSASAERDATENNCKTHMPNGRACWLQSGCTSSSFLTHSTVVDLLCECAALDEPSRKRLPIALGYAAARKKQSQSGILCLCICIQSILKP